MERYFLSSGRPDRLKTTTVVGIPPDRHSSYCSGQMREAASNVTGLHQETGLGPETQTIFMGWDAAVMSKAAKGHSAAEAESVSKPTRTSGRTSAHNCTLRISTLSRERKAPNLPTRIHPLAATSLTARKSRAGGR